MFNLLEFIHKRRYADSVVVHWRSLVHSWQLYYWSTADPEQSSIPPVILCWSAADALQITATAQQVPVRSTAEHLPIRYWFLSFSADVMLIHHWSSFNPLLICCGYIADLHLIFCWSISKPWFIHCRSSADPPLTLRRSRDDSLQTICWYLSDSPLIRCCIT